MRLNMHLTVFRAAILAALLTAMPAAAETDPAGSPAEELPTPRSLPFNIPELSPEDEDTTAPVPPVQSVTPSGGSSPSGLPVHVADAAVEDIRDIRGPIIVGLIPRWVWPSLVALLLAGLIFTVWRWRGRRAKIRALQAFEVAFARLEKARSLMQPEHARAFSYLVSETVRTYIDHRFTMGASHCTTEEFIRDLVEDSSLKLQPYTDRMRDFLGHCDLAKFARWNLTLEQMEAMHTSAWKFVEETRPDPDGEMKNEPPVVRETELAAVPAGEPALANGEVS